tara:strand:- start:1386 stop:2711 length:1326 start_codon:yes stop_codon:yes gene_type:complete
MLHASREPVPMELEATRTTAAAVLSKALLLDILLGAAANAVNQADRNIMPIAVIPMAEAYGWNMMQRGFILSSFAYGYMLTQLPGGLFATKLPPLKLLLVAVSCWSLATMLTPAAADIGIRTAFACRVVLGMAEGFCLPAIFQLFAGRVPEALRSRAFSFMLGAGSVGQLAALLVCPQLTPWPTMFSLFGGVGLCWAALCLLRMCLSSSLRDDDRGRAVPQPGESVEASDEDDGASLSSDMLPHRQPWPHGALAAICLAHLAQNWTNYTLSAWLPTYLHEELGMPTQQLSLTALPFAVNACANVGFGLLADSATASGWSLLSVRRAATLTGLLGPAVCHLLFTLTASPGMAIALVTLSFFLGAATAPGYMANHADLSSSYAGLTFAIANTIATIPGLVAPPFTAWLVEATGSWAAVFVLAALINVAGSFAYATLSDARRVL